MKTRNIALDYAKGLGILIVVFAHLWRGLAGAGLLKTIDPLAIAAISRACTILSMPTFFFASGLLYGSTMTKRHGIKEFAGKFDAIFYPYIIWSILIGVFEVLGSGVRNNGTSFSDLLTILWIPRGIFWFLYALLLTFAIAELMIYFIGARRAKWGMLAVGILLIFAYPFAPNIFCLPELCMSFLYFALGVALSEIAPKIQRPSWLMVGFLLIALALFEYWAHMLLGGGTNNLRSITPNAIVLALISLLCLMLLCYSLPSTGLSKLAMLGERSMDIYLTHLLFIATTRIVLNKIFDIHSLFIYIPLGMVAGTVGSIILTNKIKCSPFKYLLHPSPFLSLKSRISQ